MGMKELKQMFQQINGVSLDYFDENPEKLEEFFSIEARCNRPERSARYRERVSAQEKDEQNLEILSRW